MLSSLSYGTDILVDTTCSTCFGTRPQHDVLHLCDSKFCKLISVAPQFRLKKSRLDPGVTLAGVAAGCAGGPLSPGTWLRLTQAPRWICRSGVLNAGHDLD